MPRSLPLLILALVASPLIAEEAASPFQALASGKATLELRTRYEHVDNQADGKSADALTNRLALTFKSGSWRGVSATLQFESIANLAEPRYFVPQTGYGKSDHAVVGDPQLSQVNQAYVEFRGFKLGRQSLNLDNQRFIGSAAWRQNDQTFTGATYGLGLESLDLTLGHLTQVQNVFGQTRPIRAEVAHFNLKMIPGANLRAFHYAFDEGDQATGAGATYKNTSFAHSGARLDGRIWNLLYDLSVAKQRGYKDATAGGTLDAAYRFVGLGYAFAKENTLMLAQETLEGGFKTPYATLHAWNGWADRFLNTPVHGLVDRFAQYKVRRGAWDLEAGYHAYKAETDGARYGTEANLSLSRKMNAWLTLLAKAASYRADSETPVLGTPNKDLKKFWLQSSLKF